LGRPPPEIFDRHYKLWPNTDQGAKFRADRPTHLGDPMIEIKKKTSAVKLKSAPQAIASGRTKKLEI